ncbi:hypothetical protein B0H13DRAFT_1901538 [Mycena leptocephala]|nr:hypothetical protein B0H13DRAFT_1901538 [Mycena leptocephala]
MRLAELKARRSPTFFKVVKPGTAARGFCQEAALLAKQSARGTSAKLMDLTVPDGMGLPGMSLTGNHQQTFYSGIREIKAEKIATRTSTQRHLDLVQEAIAESFEIYVSDREIWKVARGRTSCRTQPNSFGKACITRTRESHLPGMRTEEDLEHILTKCASPGQEIIWKEVKNIWDKKNSKWPTPSLGLILGCGLAEFRTIDGKRDNGAERLYRILMSEAAYLIWKIRNEHVINRDREPATEQEIVNKWDYHINYRLKVDTTLAIRRSEGKKPTLAPKKVLETWSGILDNEGAMPENWLRDPRVLVGSRVIQLTRLSRGIG